MRNLKRALSLALASVMLLGMMVVGTSAASYPDVDDNDNVEAIEVLNAVNVMIGRQGNFEPDEAVNRHEMAVIMAKLVLGVETADNYVGTHPFTDVVPWADKYVAACYENGLVAGTSATTYGGGSPLTAVQAAAMMLRALGYKDLNKGYQGDWRAPITAMANQIRLFAGVASNPNEKLNRNQVAQLALNTLKSPMVNLKDGTFTATDGNGQLIISGGSREYIVLSSQEAYARAINDVESKGTSASAIGGYTVELGEHLYNGKLKLNNKDQDVFGRPARTWEYDGKEIGSYVKEELMVMDKVGGVTGNDLYTAVGKSALDDYDVLITIDGVDNKRNDVDDILGSNGNKTYLDVADINRNNKANVAGTGTGVLTQAFVDHENDEVFVAVINTYLAMATRDYDTKSEEASLKVYSIREYKANSAYAKIAKSTKDNAIIKIDVEDFPEAKDVKKDDAFLVQIADGAIQSVKPAEMLSAVNISAFKLTDHVVSGGTEYKYTTTVGYNAEDLDNYTDSSKSNLKDRTYDIYLDAYGNLIGIKEIDAAKNYVFISGIDLDGSNLSNKTATANAIFLDGTSKVIKINMTKSKWTANENKLAVTNVAIQGHALLNTWATYSVSGDVYTITEVNSTGAGDNSTADSRYVPQPSATGTVLNKTKLAQFHQYTTDYVTPASYKTKDSKVSVKYMRLNGGGNSTLGYEWVYGDSDSVYLTAELAELQDTKDAGKGYGIIKDADAVTTGIADTNITVWSEEYAIKKAEDAKITSTVASPNCSHGIYTLYNDKGIVVAAVIVGENEGVKDMVYVHSEVPDLESDNDSGSSTRAANDGLWTWTRRVIRNGQEVTLTEVNDALTHLGKDQMVQYHWYEIRTNANGEVISAEPAFEALDTYQGGKSADAGHFVIDYKWINERVETTNKDTVLYQTDGGPAHIAGEDWVHPVGTNGHIGFSDELRVIGNNTLAVTTMQGSGIHFRDNVNVVLQYYNQNTKKEQIETGTGVDELKSMVDFVNANNPTRGSAHYYVSALIEKGFATTIVIYDSYNNYKTPESSVNYVKVGPNTSIAKVNELLLKNNVEITGDAWQPNETISGSTGRENTVYIPSNRILKIDGDFIAYRNGEGGNKVNIYVTSEDRVTSRLIVGNDFYMANQTLAGKTEVGGDMIIRTSSDSTGITYLDADITVTDNMIVVKDTGSNVRVTSNGNVKVMKNLSATKELWAPDANVTFTIYGHMEIGNDGYDNGYTITAPVNPIHYEVLSSSTLKAGTLYGTFCLGDSSRTGRVVVDDLRTTASPVTHSGATLNRGELRINGVNYTKGFNIGSGAPKIAFGPKAADDAKVFVTATGEQADVSDNTYTFTKNATNVTVTGGDSTEPIVIPSTDGVINEVKDEDAKPVVPDQIIRNPKPVAPAVVLGDTLKNVTAEDGAHYTVGATTWTLGTTTVTKAETAGTYTWTATLTAENGYTFADGKTTATVSGTVVVADTSKQATVTVTTVEGATVKVNSVSPDDNGKVIVEAGEVTVTVEVADETKVAVIKVDTVENKTGKFTAEAGKTYTVTVTLKNKGDVPGSDLPNAPGATKVNETTVNVKYLHSTTVNAAYLIQEVNKVEGFAITGAINIDLTAGTATGVMGDKGVSITLTKVYEVKLDDQLIGYTPVTGDNTNFTGIESKYVILAADKGGATSTSKVDADGKLTVPALDPETSTVVELFTAYAVSMDNSTVTTMTTDSGVTEGAAWSSFSSTTAKLLIEGDKIKATGTSTSSSNPALIQLKVGEKLIGQPAAPGATGTAYATYTIDGTEADKDGNIVVSESKAYKITVDNNEATAVNGVISVNYPADTLYVPVLLTADTTPKPIYWVADGNKVATIADPTNSEKSYIQVSDVVSASGVRADGTIVLLRGVVVNTGTGTAVISEAAKTELNGVAGNDMTAATNNVVAVGTKLTMKSATGTANKVLIVNGECVSKAATTGTTDAADGEYTIKATDTTVTVKLGDAVQSIQIDGLGKAINDATAATIIGAVKINGSDFDTPTVTLTKKGATADDPDSDLTGTDAVATGDKIVVTISGIKLKVATKAEKTLNFLPETGIVSNTSEVLAKYVETSWEKEADGTITATIEYTVKAAENDYKS